MQTIKNFLSQFYSLLSKNKYLLFIVGSLFFTLVGLLIFRIPFLGGVVRIVFLLLIANSIFAFLSGFYARRFGLRWWSLLIFPLIFLTIALTLNLIPRLYALVFSPFYLVVSLFTFLADYRYDPDENQILVEGGFGRKNNKR